MAQVKVMPPSVGGAIWADRKLNRPKGIIFAVGSHGVETLLKGACRQGLPLLTLTRMKDLIRLLGIDLRGRRRPTTVYECARTLIAFGLGVDYADQTTLKPILDKRGCKPPPRFAVTLTEADSDLTEGVLNTEDVGDIRKTLAEVASRASEARSGQKVAAPKAKAASTRSGGSAASSSAPARPRLLELLGGEEVDVAWARGLLPPGVTGCTLSKDSSFHYRFVGAYPRDTAPRIATEAWNSSVSEWQACVHCLAWIWKSHCEKTGAPCPYEFQHWV